jgi:alkylated DNA repair dioxygenase AlkB
MQAEQQWPLLHQLKLRIEQDFEQTVNYALANRYSRGDADIPWHSDKESDMVPNSWIFSISLGCERPFQFKPKKGKHTQIMTVDPLKHLIMNMATQHHYLHSLPKRSVAKYNTERYNITFRKMKQ